MSCTLKFKKFCMGSLNFQYVVFVKSEDKNLFVFLLKINTVIFLNFSDKMT
jgi:hypothetical protein